MNRRDALKTLGVSAVAVTGWSALNAMGQGQCPRPGDTGAAPADGAGHLPADRPSGRLGPVCRRAIQLPPLPYGYDGLEPHIDRETLTIHHDKHHAGLCNGLNAASPSWPAPASKAIRR